MDRRRQHRDQVHLGRQSSRARWRGLALFGVLAGWLFAHPAQAANCTYRQDALGHTRYRCDDGKQGTLRQGESVNILLNFTQFFETRIEYRFQIFTAHSCDFLLPSYARLA